MSTFKGPFVRSAFNYDTMAVSNETGLACNDESLCQQQFVEEVDINTIVRRFGLDGELPESVVMPQNSDFEEIFDFQSAMNAVVAARESFDEMPARIRSRFHNNPAEFVDFCSNPDNRDEALKLGLVEKPATSESPAQPVAKAEPVAAAEPPKGGTVNT